VITPYCVFSGRCFFHLLHRSIRSRYCERIDQLRLPLLAGVFAQHPVASYRLNVIAGFGRVVESNSNPAMPKACADYARARPSPPISKLTSFCATNKQKGYLNLTTPLRPFQTIHANKAFCAHQAIATNEGRFLCSNPIKSSHPISEDLFLERRARILCQRPHIFNLN
jgi:hypothetical protein